MNQVTLIGTITSTPTMWGGPERPQLGLSIQTEEIRFQDSKRIVSTHTHSVYVSGEGVTKLRENLREGVVVAVSGKLHSKPDTTYVLAEHLDILSGTSAGDETSVIDLESPTRLLGTEDSTSRVSYDGHTRKV